jgi:hypothetical protein
LRDVVVPVKLPLLDDVLANSVATLRCLLREIFYEKQASNSFAHTCQQGSISAAFLAELLPLTESVSSISEILISAEAIQKNLAS